MTLFNTGVIFTWKKTSTFSLARKRFQFGTWEAPFLWFKKLSSESFLEGLATSSHFKGIIWSSKYFSDKKERNAK